jgi:uncharacterized glyoxalase superfamily protein PhnB
MSLQAIGIVSADLKKSVKFYKILGVNLKPVMVSTHLEGTTPGGIDIMVDDLKSIKQIYPKWKKPKGPSGVVLCFKQKSPAEVDKVHAKLLKAGFKSLNAPWDAFWGQRYANVSDPDGNQIDLYATLRKK